MYEQRTNHRYNYVVQMIRSTSHTDSTLLELFDSEDPCRSKSLFYFIRKASMGSKYVNPEMNNKKAYRILIDAVSDYLEAYSTSASMKNRMYERLYAWCTSIGEQNQIEDYPKYLKDLQKPVSTDLAVELVKGLHDPEGVCKNELAHHYNVSEKTIQVAISRLNDKSCADPLRIGGQAVHVPVSRKEEKHRTDKRRYYTPNTMSPLIFQMNLMQVATLLQSLHLNYESGNNIPLDLAVDAWSQLSDYAKNRIREIFCKRDPAFSLFLDVVEDEERSDTYRYMTESEMMRDGDSTWGEKLNLAYKGGMVCNLSLSQPFRSRKNQRIIYDHGQNSFYAIPVNDEAAKPLYFSVEDIIELEEA